MNEDILRVLAFYESNNKFKEYVDKYCKATGKKIYESLGDKVVQIVANDYKVRELIC